MLPSSVTAGRDLVGVRVPSHRVAQDLLRAAGVPVAAPSANRFGHVSPTSADHVLADLDGTIDAVLDAGPCQVGVESTVLDPATLPMAIYRAGAVTLDQIVRCSGIPTVLFASSGQSELEPSSLPSPGVGLRHYAPRVPLYLTEATPAAVRVKVDELSRSHRKVAVLLPSDWDLVFEPDVFVERWGAWQDSGALATTLFACLRSLEQGAAEVLVAPLPNAGGLGDALRDRLQKAARPA